MKIFRFSAVQQIDSSKSRDADDAFQDHDQLMVNELSKILNANGLSYPPLMMIFNVRHRPSVSLVNDALAPYETRRTNL